MEYHDTLYFNLIPLKKYCSESYPIDDNIYHFKNRSVKSIRYKNHVKMSSSFKQKQTPYPIYFLRRDATNG